VQPPSSRCSTSHSLALRLVVTTVARPRGSLDLHGRARRVKGIWIPAYRAELGQRLRRARLEAGIAVSELAAAAGAHPRTIHSIEAGRILDPHYSTIVRLALALSLAPSELVP
jgi:DNA-binding XRE family transcriptional regulator